MKKGIIVLIFIVFGINQSVSAQCRCTASNSHRNFGSTCEVYGTVAEVKSFPSKNGAPIYVNFDKEFPAHTFTLVIWGDEFPKMLQKVQQMIGQKVAVRGKIQAYKGRPQIIYKNGVGLKILESSLDQNHKAVSEQLKN